MSVSPGAVTLLEFSVWKESEKGRKKVKGMMSWGHQQLQFPDRPHLVIVVRLPPLVRSLIDGDEVPFAVGG